MNLYNKGGILNVTFLKISKLDWNLTSDTFEAILIRFFSDIYLK